MAYAYWKSERHDDRAVFELFFRKNPFGGEFTVFAGLEECLKFLEEYRFSEADLASVERQFLETLGEDCFDRGFLAYLAGLDASEVQVSAFPEGALVFPREPLLTISGPLAVCQLLETTLLNLVNFPSLVATNAARHRLAAPDKRLVEFGLRRAQGPDGAMTASRYSYLGGFDGTSNVLAGATYGIPVSGTHAHAFVSSFHDFGQIRNQELKHRTGDNRAENFLDACLACRSEVTRALALLTATNDAELAAFVTYAISYPKSTLLLVDTYDTLSSGIPNFLAVALALHRFGYKAVGIRLDSGDLAYLSTRARAMFATVAASLDIPYFERFTIVASNDLNESTLISLREQGHSIDVFGVGTNLVTCQRQPALGCVYKIVQVGHRPCIKLSNDASKVTIPFSKTVFRLSLKDGPVLDLLLRKEENSADDLQPKKRVLCLHPFDDKKRVYVTPHAIQVMTEVVWANGKRTMPSKTLSESRAFLLSQLKHFRADHLRPLNPTPFKVSLSENLFSDMHQLWRSEMPITELE